MKNWMRYLVIAVALVATLLSVWSCGGDGKETTVADDETTTAADDTTVDEADDTTEDEETEAPAE